MNKLIFFYFLLSSIFVLGQDEFENYVKKYPGKNGVIINKENFITIDIDKKGEPTIESKTNDEVIYLNDNYKYYVDHSIGFSSFTSVESVVPIVYVPYGEKYKKIKIKDFSIEDDMDGDSFSDDYKNLVFYYEGLQKGGKTSLSYVRHYYRPHFFGTFYFTNHLPVENIVYSIQTPKHMKIGFKLFGDEKDKVSYSKETKGNVTVHKWVAKDLENYELEDRAVDISYNAVHIQTYIKSYQFNGEQKNILRNVDDLYAYYRGFVKDVNTEGNESLIALADSLTKNMKDDDEKVKKIFYWVQDNIKYVAFEDGLGGFVPRKASLVCDRKYGDCKDMSSVLYTMINGIGLPAYYTWVGTRSIPYTYDEVPTLSTDNHMICTYFDGENYIFLDGTGKGGRFGFPTAFIQGKQALVGVSKTEYKLINVPVIEVNANSTIDTVYARIEGDLVVGEGLVQYTGYSSLYLSNYLANASSEEKKEFYEDGFKKGNNKCTSEVTKVTGVKDRDGKLIMEYNFSIPDYLHENNNELYLNPFLKKYLTGAKINTDALNMDRERLFKEGNRNVVIFEIPEDYTIEYLPENTSFEHQDFGYVINFKLDETKRTVEVSTQFKYDFLILKNEDFKNWNRMIKQLNQAYAELIILKKK